MIVNTYQYVHPHPHTRYNDQTPVLTLSVCLSVHPFTVRYSTYIFMRTPRVKYFPKSRCNLSVDPVTRMSPLKVWCFREKIIILILKHLHNNYKRTKYRFRNFLAPGRTPAQQTKPAVLFSQVLALVQQNVLLVFQNIHEQSDSSCSRACIETGEKSYKH